MPKRIYNARTRTNLRIKVRNWMRRRKNPKRGAIGRKNPIYSVHKYVRSMDAIALHGVTARYIQQTGAPQNFALEFTLDTLPNFAEFTNLYDQYKINRITVSLIPMLDMNGANAIAATTVLNPGIMGSVLDFDDSVALGSINDYLQYNNWRMQPCISKRTHRRTIYPRVKKEVLTSGGASVAGLSGSSGWIDCNFPSIPHYGMKIYLDPQGAANAPQTFQIFLKFWLQFKNTR